jgi:hypothetical protein
VTRALVSLLAVLLFLSGCGEPQAGNSVETENTAGARVLEVDSFLPAWNHPTGGTVATLRFDRANFVFSASTRNGRDLRFERLDGSLLPFEVDVWDTSAEIGRVLVRLDSSLYAPQAAVRMRWGSSQASSANPTGVWSGLPDSVALLANSVLVDDFEGGDDTTKLPDLDVWRDGFSDSAYVSPLAFPTAGQSRPGTALHVTYSAPSPSYAVVATSLSNGPRSLRSLDSLVFWARGTGTLSVAFEHLTGLVGPKAWAQIPLDTGWTRVRIRPTDLDSADGIGYNFGWSYVRDSVTDLTFILQDGSDFWLDDVRLHGIDRDDLR